MAAAGSLPFASGNLIRGVSFDGGTAVVAHGLGRAWTGYFVASVIADPDLTPGGFFAIAPSDLYPADRVIALRNTIACTGDVWVW
jgi:hypothetical protein